MVKFDCNYTSYWSGVKKSREIARAKQAGSFESKLCEGPYY